MDRERALQVFGLSRVASAPSPGVASGRADLHRPPAAHDGLRERGHAAGPRLAVLRIDKPCNRIRRWRIQARVGLPVESPVMSSVMVQSAANVDSTDFQWHWRHAQQSFAGLLASTGRNGVAAPSSALAALSALSADERPAFERWLALHLVARDTFGIAARLRDLGRVDALLAASVRRLLPRVAAELLRPVSMAAAA